jgi:hypothetical protein
VRDALARFSFPFKDGFAFVLMSFRFMLYLIYQRLGPGGAASRRVGDRASAGTSLLSDLLCGPSFETRPEGAPQDEVSS